MKINRRRISIVMILLALIISGSIFLLDDKMDVISFISTDQTIPEDWRLILVNSKHSIPKDYQFETFQLSNGVYIDARIYPDLQQMFDDARNQGIFPTVGEGYRTHEEQQKMMEDKIESFMIQGYSRREAKKLSKEWVAVPGTSEHELGIALDINADESGLSSNWDVYGWLAENAYLYGFILRYPQDKEEITGIDYEPWHYRYVGKESALEIYTKQITLEEYLE